MQRGLNHNGTDGADAAGINMMLTFLVLVMLIVMVMRMLMVTTVHGNGGAGTAGIIMMLTSMASRSIAYTNLLRNVKTNRGQVQPVLCNSSAL